MEWEHNQLIRQRKAVLATAPAAATGVGPPMPSDAEMKLDWLRRKREEHEVRLRKTMTIRSESQLNPAEPDDAAVKREWLRRKRRITRPLYAGVALLCVWCHRWCQQWYLRWCHPSTRWTSKSSSHAASSPSSRVRRQ